MRAGERDGRVDRALVVAAQGGDRRAVDELLAGCLPLVYNIVGRALDGHQDVDDAVQETLIRAVDHLGDLRDPSAFRSWLVAIAMRQVRDRWRARQARPVVYGEAFEASLDAADPGADFVDLTILRLELSDQRRETALATRWLDADDRELLSLWWLEAAGELSRAELVDALGLEPGHVSVRVQRLRQQLDTARVVVRALAAVPLCTGLGELAHGWDGRPSSLWRKRFARHTRDCILCAAYWQGLVPSERLLSGLALVPVPALSAAKWTATTASSPAVTAGRVRIRGGRHGAGRGKLVGAASAKVIAAGAVLAVVAGAGVVYAAMGTAPRKVAAASTYHRAETPKSSSPAPSPSPRSAPAKVRRPAPARASASPAPGLTI